LLKSASAGLLHAHARVKSKGKGATYPLPHLFIRMGGLARFTLLLTVADRYCRRLRKVDFICTESAPWDRLRETEGVSHVDEDRLSKSPTRVGRKYPKKSCC
jgi:hypothetical protein